MLSPQKQLILRRFSKHFDTYNHRARVQEDICRTLAEKLIPHLDPTSLPQHVLEIGTGTGFLTRALSRQLRGARWTLNDLAPEFSRYIEPSLFSTAPDLLIGDAESLPFPDCELIVTASTIQWFEDISSFFKKAHASLPPGGILALSTFGPQNFHQLIDLTDAHLTYPSSEKLLDYAHAAGFHPLAHEDELVTLSFPGSLHILRYMKDLGLNAIPHARWTRQSLEKFLTRYVELHSTPDEQVTLTYHPLYLILKK